MNIKTFVGDYELLHSSSVSVADGKSIYIHIEELKFKFMFSGLVNGNITTNIVDNELHITLGDHSDPMGYGLYEPWSVAQINEKNIYITFHVDFKKTNERIEFRLFQFSIYSQKKSEHEQ